MRTEVAKFQPSSSQKYSKTHAASRIDGTILNVREGGLDGEKTTHLQPTGVSSA